MRHTLSIAHADCTSDSGHGGQTKDLDGDEADGYDEGALTDKIPLCPSDVAGLQ